MTLITSVDGLDELRAVPGVEEIILNRGPGQAVNWRDGNHGHVFSVFGTVASHVELLRVEQLVGELVHIKGS
jgi:hypothetical protein